MVIWREIHEAWRRLVKRPGHSLLSVLVLGIGLGVVMFFFGAVNDVVLQPYPFPHADRLMAIGVPQLEGSRLDGIGLMDSDQYLALKGKLASVDRMGALVTTNASVDNGQGATYHTGASVTASILAMLGAKPILGRNLTAADDAVGAPRVVVLSGSYWRHAFGANPKVVGTSVRISGKFYTVVGVLPKNFRFPSTAQFWLPLRLQPGQHTSLLMVARLKQQADLAQARAELNAWDGRLKRVLPTNHERQHALAMAPLSWAFSNWYLRHWVWMMFAAGVLVLLLAAINVANLEWVKSTRRSHELALRSALGSSRLRLLLGPLVESWLLGVAALALAFAVSWACLAWFVASWLSIYPETIPYMHGVFTVPMFAFGIVVALFTTSLASGLPAWRASRSGLEAALRDDSKGTSRSFVRVTRVLVIAEVVLSVVLLVGAGIFVRAMHRLLTQPDVGATHAAHVLTASIDLPSALYQYDAKRIRFFQQVVQDLGQNSNVVAATASNTVSSAFLGSYGHVSLPGHGEPADGWPWVQIGIVGPQFLKTYGVRLVAGRFFGPQDDASAASVAVIDARTAARFWPHQGALHRRLVLDPGKPDARTATVIGVVERLNLDTPLDTPYPAVLMPLAQAAGQVSLRDVGFAVRVHGNAMAFLPQLVAAVHGVDGQTAVFGAMSQAKAMANARAGLVVLAGAFIGLGLVALLLAAAGLYGVLAFSVGQRTREIGIRRAIGAGNGAIVQTVGRQLVWQLGIGLVIGFVLAWPASGLLGGADQELGLRAHDPLVFVSVLVVVIAASVIATLVPLVRALRVDPAEALRYE